MTATQFTDDAYNKWMHGMQIGHGTLIGNWSEEQSQRDGTGEGRCVPAKHIRRSGLLKDFTRVPTDGLRRCDDTFERLYGHRKYDVWNTSAADVGKPDGSAHVTELRADPCQAEGRIPRVGPKYINNRALFTQHAEEYVQAQLDAEAALLQVRHFETENMNFSMPNPNEVEIPTHQRSGAREELLHGAPLPESEVYGINGLDFKKDAHYTLQEAVTGSHQFASNLDTQGAVTVTPCVNGFRKEATLTTPLEHYNKRTECTGFALQKDGLEPRNINMPMVATNVAPQLRSGNAPVSLVDVKGSIADVYREKFGTRVYIDLRRVLEDFTQSDGTIKIGDLNKVFASEAVPAFATNVYCKHLCTMAKDRAQIIKIMESLRPTTPSKRMQEIARAWDCLATGDGLLVVEWVAGLHASIKDEVTADLGLPEGLPPTSRVLLQKASWYDYCQDLSAGYENDSDFSNYIAILCSGR